jgi:cysteine desulfurase/selenocysteine lyase
MRLSTNKSIDINQIRLDFPALNVPFHNKPLIYLDSAVSSLVPKQVTDRMSHYQQFEHTNVHRGVSTLSQEATDRFEEAREKVRAFINAPSSTQIIWTRGTTESINLVAQTFGRTQINAGDEILLSAMEHHSNIVPWQTIAKEKNAKIRVIPMNNIGELILDNLEDMLTEHTKIVGVTHVSNVLGTINPIKEIIHRAHARNIITIIDGAQGVPHLPVDVTNLDADFYTFSGHKLYGPTGIGVLYGRKELLENMPIWQGGGSMVLSVDWDKAVFCDIPAKFEAGTPPITQAIGMGAAIDYVLNIGLDNIAKHEHSLLMYATERLKSIPDLSIIGQSDNKTGIISFTLGDIHPHDIGSILDYDGIIVRAGHHCAQPIMKHFNLSATTRVSFSCFNTMEEIDALVSSVNKVREMFN